MITLIQLVRNPLRFDTPLFGAALRFPLRSLCIAAGSALALSTRMATEAGSAELGSQLKLPIIKKQRINYY